MLGATPPGPNTKDEKTGTWVCTSCHDPHGTAETAHFLKTEIAVTLVRTKEKNPHRNDIEACGLCHTTSFADEITNLDNKLLYNGNAVMLCISCHITVRGHHPTGVRLPIELAGRYQNSGKVLPLDKSRTVTCVTCHDTNCASGEFKMSVRYYDSKNLVNDLCWGCHSKETFASKDPHGDNPENCKWCHEARPLPGVNGESGLIASPTMICLQCHSVTPHPSRKNHVGLAMGTLVMSNLPHGSGAEIICTTCHNPHHRADMPKERLRKRTPNLCKSCHRSYKPLPGKDAEDKDK
jgi:predicted CXXCH cytochrome family protein